MRIDFSGVETKNFDAIPAGSYKAKVTNYEVRESGPNAKNPGAQYINWEFTIQEGEYEGRKQWTNTSLLPQALFALKDMLAATGKFEVDGELDFDPDDVVGADLVIVVKRKKNDDDEYTNEIKKFRSTAEAGTTSASVLP